MSRKKVSGKTKVEMCLNIRQREKEGVVILDLTGRLTAGDESGLLRDTIHELIEAGPRNVLLNLQEVDYIDSTGLGALVVSFTSVRKARGSLKLMNLGRRNIELLVFTKLETIFEIFDEEQSAVNSFFPGREIKRFDILNFVQQESKK